MRKFNITEEDFDKGFFSKEESRHILNVLRMREGEALVINKGDGFDYEGEITQISGKEVGFKIMSKTKNLCDPKIHVTLLQGMPKGDKLELIAQKACELGASALIPFTQSHSIGALSENKLARLEKIAMESVKQCGRSRGLKIGQAISFSQLLDSLKSFDLVVFPSEHEKSFTFKELFDCQNKPQNIAIVVGSEGGFSTFEHETLSALENLKSVTFGNRILRLETAAISSLALVMTMMED